MFPLLSEGRVLRASRVSSPSSSPELFRNKNETAPNDANPLPVLCTGLAVWTAAAPYPHQYHVIGQ